MLRAGLRALGFGGPRLRAGVLGDRDNAGSEYALSDRVDGLGSDGYGYKNRYPNPNPKP